MGSVLQFAAFLCICCLFRSVATHSNQDESRRLNKKLSNSGSPEVEDFYFIEEDENDDNVKNGRTISQSSWSKEDNEPNLPINKTSTQSSGEFSLKNFASYLLGVVQDLQKEIFGIKKMTSLKNTEESKNSHHNFEDNDKQTELEENNDASKSIDSKANTGLKNENDQMKSNYITYFYQKNGIKFIDDEDLENSRDVSDDSSHKPNEGAKITTKSKSKENTHNFKCMRIKTKPDKYSFKVENTTITPTSQTQTLHKSVKEFGDDKENRKDDNFKKPTTKSTRTEQNSSKASRKETEKGSALPQRSKPGNGIKKNITDSINNLTEKNEPTKEPLKSSEYATKASSQNRKRGQEESKQDETVISKSPGRNSKTKESLDFDTKSSTPVQSTMLPLMDGKDATYSENETYASKMSSENQFYQKQQEQITSPKPEDQIQVHNNVKSFENFYEINEQTIQTTPRISNHKKSTDANIFDSEMNGNPEESEDKGSTIFSPRTIIAYNEHELNLKMDEKKSPDSFDTITPTTAENLMNTDNMNKETSDNLNDNKRTDENEYSVKLISGRQDENSSEIEKDSEIEQTPVQEVTDYSKPEKFLKNKILNDTNPKNNNNGERDNLTISETTDDPDSEHSNHEIENHAIEESDKLQEVLRSNKSFEIQDISADYEYEERDIEDFDIYDELDDMEEFHQNQESNLSTNNADIDDNDEINPNTNENILTNESEISQRNVMEEESQGQYDTFLEYFYNHSNSPFFQSLKNQSSNFYDEM